MVDYVIDTNVWVTVDKPLAQASSNEEFDCIESCNQWLRRFMNSDDRLVVDRLYVIFKEYRGQITPSRRRANQWLNALERAPRNKIVDVDIQWDDDGYAVIPFHLTDPNDRKFAAVALAHNPTPPIVNATDADWETDKAQLQKAGIIIQELCPVYIQKIIRKKAGE